MLVDNPILQPSILPEYTDISDLLNSDLFAMPGSSSPSSSPSSSSPRSPPDAFTLLTPPHSHLPFINVESSSPSDFFTFSNLEDEFTKSAEAFPPPVTSLQPFDFLAGFDMAGGGDGSASSITVPEFLTSSGSSPESTTSSSFSNMCIDPQLVGSPSVVDEDEDQEEKSQEKELERQQDEFVIPPIKVGGHGKGRKGTVQGGGITKKTSAVHKDKEDFKFTSSVISPVSPASRASFTDRDDDCDEVPADWRPPREVYEKMSSKEKRQLRNKISARNFRVRRKEYISTLEGDIAERDRILSAIRSELGSSRSENAALRQEIAALKKVLLVGRASGETNDTEIKEALNLPPPAPLPAQSAAEFLAATAASKQSASSSPDLLTPNTQKDLPTSPRIGARGFWGGAHVGLGSGVTPVHTAIMPEWPSSIRGVLQENLNPALNGVKKDQTMKQVSSNIGTFDKFADSTPLTFPSMDTYRMQLWNLYVQQQRFQQQHPHHQPQQHQQSHLHGLAANIRPHFFTSSKQNMAPASSYPTGSSLSALLSGKSRALTPSSPVLMHKDAPSTPSPISAPSSLTQKQQQQQNDAMVVALASQTLMGRLGSAFWDAFSGSSESPSSSSTTKIDADKVRRVLEGKAVVKVVDVEPTPLPDARIKPVEVKCKVEPQDNNPCKHITDILEESMRSLSLGKRY